VNDVSYSTRGVRSLILGTVLFLSCAYFYEAGGWNQNSRFDMVRAVVGQRTLKIDRFADNTGDKAVYDGHTYSDKAPGVALSAIPFVEVASRVLRAWGVDPESPGGVTALSYIATAIVSGLSTALAGVCLALTVEALFGSASAGLLVGAVFVLGTPAWAYATLLMGHALSTSCIVFAFGAAVALGRTSNRQLRIALAFVVGLFAGWATVTEMSSAVPALVMTAMVIWTERLDDLPGVSRVLGGLLVGALACVAVLLAYNTLAFGSPFHLGYESEQGFDELKTGFFGITYPKLDIAIKLLFGRLRGLFPLAPILALAPLGWFFWARDRAADRVALCVAIVIPLYYLWLNSSYFYWEGGWSYGPRHMAPALPFLALALAPLWTLGSRPLRIGLGLIGVVSVALTLIGVSVTPQPPYSYDSPFAQLWWPAFKAGDLSVNHTSFDMATYNPLLVRDHPEAHQAWNLGELAGLQGLKSLLPLVAMWAVAGASWRRATRAPESMQARPGAAPAHAGRTT
jgi:hypothetical protein